MIWFGLVWFGSRFGFRSGRCANWLNTVSMLSLKRLCIEFAVSALERFRANIGVRARAQAFVVDSLALPLPLPLPLDVELLGNVIIGFQSRIHVSCCRPLAFAALSIFCCRRRHRHTR